MRREALVTGTYIFRSEEETFLAPGAPAFRVLRRKESCGATPQLRGLAPLLFNASGRPWEALKARCGVRARTGGFLWLSTADLGRLDLELRKDFLQKAGPTGPLRGAGERREVFGCLTGPMKRLPRALSASGSTMMGRVFGRLSA